MTRIEITILMEGTIRATFVSDKGEPMRPHFQIIEDLKRLAGNTGFNLRSVNVNQTDPEEEK